MITKPKTTGFLSEPAPDRDLADLQHKLRGLQEQRTNAIKVQNRDPGMRELVERLDGEIAGCLARLRALRPPTTGEKLAELEIEIGTAETELNQLRARRSVAIAAKLKREPDAEDRLQQIVEAIDTAEGSLSVLQQRRAEIQQHIAAQRAEDSRSAAEAKPARLAELHREHMALAETVTRAAQTLATALRRIDGNGTALAALLDDQGARNFLSAPALRRRANNALARAFVINSSAPLTVGNSILGLASDASGEQACWTLIEWEQQGLDDLVAFYLSEAEAEEARHRLALRNCPTVIIPLHGAFTLARFEHVFGDEASARHAATRSATPMAVLAHDGGFVLLPSRYAEAA